MRSIKVLHVFGKMDRGGAEMRTLELLQELRNIDMDVQFDFCVLSGESGELDTALRNLGSQVYFMPLKKGFSRKFKKFLKHEAYDSVHSHVHLFSGYLLKLALAAGVTSRICHLHTTGGYGEGQIRKRVQNWFMKKWLFQYSTAVLAVSKGVEKIFLNKVPSFRNDQRLQVLYDGVDPKSFIFAKNRESLRHELGFYLQQSIVIHVGRLDPVKNHVRLVQIFALIAQKFSDAQLVLVGKMEGPSLEILIQQVRGLGLVGKVHFLGARADVRELLFAADLMIFPSLWEGLPGAVLEAGVIGLPVLATDLPGCIELAEHFDSIHVLPLSMDNSDWANAAAGLLQVETKSRIAKLEILRVGPFNVTNALNKLLPLWRR